MYTIGYIYTYAFCYIPHLRKGYVIFFLTLCDLNNTIYAKFTHLPWLFVMILFRAEEYSIALTFHVQHLYHMPLIFLSIFGQFQPVPVIRALQYNLRLGETPPGLTPEPGSEWSFKLFPKHMKLMRV